jgi:intracellular septation protein A
MSGLILGLIPLIIFAVLDATASLNVALIALAIATVIECVYTISAFGALDSISAMSIGLVVLLGGLAYKKKSAVIIKLKPAILNGGLGLMFLFHSLMNQPLFNQLIEKYPQLVPENLSQIIATPNGALYFSLISLYTGYALIIHAGLVAYAGLKWNNFWWGVMSTIGLFIAIVIATIVAGFQIQ